jgi:PP-loop superfamily ATP-utilizing enzyme
MTAAPDQPLPRIIVWYSDGAASAVAAKLARDKYGDRAMIVKCDTTADEHPDNLRFRKEVERWIGATVSLIQSDKFSTIDDVFEKTRYMAGIAGARCTTELKKLVRQRFERPDDIHIFGYTSDEHRRALRFQANNPELSCEWILADSFIRKQDCHRMLREAGISQPVMYSLGFEHNNCIGCVKATSPGYWNRTRREFPEAFARRALQSRDIGARLVRVRNERIFLDELGASEGLDQPDGQIECGPFCEMDGLSK